MTTATDATTTSSWYDRFSGTLSYGRDCASYGLGKLAETLHPKVWGGLGVLGSVYAAAEFTRGHTTAGIAGLWSAFSCIGTSMFGGASREEAETTVHASTLAFGGTLAVNGIQEMTSGRAPAAPRGFFSSATGQLLTGAGIVYGAFIAGPRLTTYMSLLGTTALTSALFMKVGINRMLRGQYLSGAGYTVMGTAGIAGSFYTAYLLMSVPQDSSDLYLPPEPFNTEQDLSGVPRRRVKLVTVVDGDSESLEGASQSQEAFARFQEIERETLTPSQCPKADGKCTPLDYAVQQCEDPTQQRKVVAIMRGDTPITNPNFSLHRMWDQLRMTKDGDVVPAQVVLVREGGADQRINPNFLFFEVDQGGASCKFLRDALEHRAESHLSSSGLDTPLRDQTAITLAMQQDWGNGVLSVLPRDEAHPYRGHIALSTLAEEGAEFSWKPGDFFGQPARCQASQKSCEESTQSVTRMLEQRETPIEWTFVMTSNEDLDSPYTTVDIARRNQQLMAKMHHGKFVEDTSPMELQATHPFKDTSGRVYEPGKVPADVQLAQREAAPYWRKVDFAKRFVDQPPNSDVQRIMVYGDTDLLMNPRVDLYEMWKREVGDSGAVMVVGKENPRIGNFITNTGFFMLKANEDSKKLLKYWAMGVDHPSWKPEDVDFPTHGWGRTQLHGLHEQTVLDELIRSIKDLPVRVIPTREPGRGYTGVNTYKRDGVLVGGWIPEPFSYDQDQAYPEIIAKPGDAIVQAAGVPKKGHLFGEAADGPLRRRYVTHVQREFMPSPRYIPIYSAPKGEQK